MKSKDELAPEVILDKIKQMQDDFWEIYFIEFGPDEFLYRELSRKEYTRLVQSFPDVGDLEEAVCSTAVFMPENYDFKTCPAGIPTNLASEILLKSGFNGGDPNEMLDKISHIFAGFRNEMSSLESQIAVIIVEAFPQYKLHEVAEWPLTKSLWYLSRAEYAMTLRGTPIEISGLDIQERAPEPKPTAPAMPTKGKYGTGREIEGDLNSHTFPELAALDAFMRGD